LGAAAIGAAVDAGSMQCRHRTMNTALIMMFLSVDNVEELYAAKGEGLVKTGW
jgi:hypothetical protein